MPQAVPVPAPAAHLTGAAVLLVSLVMLALAELVMLSETAVACWLRRSIGYEVDTWYLRLGLYKRLPQLSRAKLLRDMRLIEQQYEAHPYHGAHHAADVVGKCGAMLRRDQSKLRRWLRERVAKGAAGILFERQYALFELVVVLAAAFHDAGHPGLGNGYLKSSNDQRFQAYNYTAERYSEQWFRHEFMQQQSFLDGLSAAERDFVVDVASYAVLRTDMRVHASVLDMADPDESDPLKRLAALLLHAADLANGADVWSISKLWARWCHKEFHSQGDASQQQHPEILVDFWLTTCSTAARPTCQKPSSTSLSCWWPPPSRRWRSAALAQQRRACGAARPMHRSAAPSSSARRSSSRALPHML